MSGSDKSRYFAAFLVGLITTGIAFATLAYSFQLGNLSGYNEAQSYGYAGKYPESTAKSIDICFGNPELSHRQECIEQAIASGRESQRAEYDLNAQRDMAEWAFWLLVLTGLGLVVTIVGTIGLYWQIMLTREAVRDTGNATAAMVRQNELTENAQRPYVGIVDVAITHLEIGPDIYTINGEGGFVGVKISADVTIKNFGKSTALNCRLGMEIASEPRSDDEVYGWTNEQVIFPNQETTIKKFSLAKYEDIFLDTAQTFWLRLKLIYHSIGDDTPFEVIEAWHVAESFEGGGTAPMDREHGDFGVFDAAAQRHFVIKAGEQPPTENQKAD